MLIRNTTERWGSVSKTLHWLMALLIISQFVLGWTADSWDLSPSKVKLFVWHKSIGILVLSLALLRLAWRFVNPTPELPHDLPAAERRAAAISHAALYGLMIAMPLSGWVINSAANFPLKVFWLWRLPNIVGPDKGLQDLAEIVHLTLFWTFITVLAVHVLAALRHHLRLRNNILSRMLPAAPSSRRKV